MMILFIYLMLSAKPVSFWRLCAFFVLSAAVAAMILSILHVPHSSTTALHVASAITFAAWVFPLIRIVRTIRHRSARNEILGVVSIPVQLSYWSSLLLTPVILMAGLSAWLHADSFRLGAVSQAVAVTLICTPLLLMAAEVCRKHLLMNRSPVRQISICERRGAIRHRPLPVFRTRGSERSLGG